jgi:hypothetical protein
MSEEHEPRSERDERRGGDEMWKSEIRDLPGLYFDLRSQFLVPEYYDWIEEMKQEPPAVSLQELIGEDVCWCGSEEWLIEKLRARAARYAAGNFPSTLRDLQEYMAVARGVFGNLDLDLLNYRELSDDSLMYWREEVTYLPGAPRWGPETPVLVCRRSRMPAVEYYWALGKVLRLWDPFPLSLLLFTERDDHVGPAGRWIGPTFVLVNILRAHYPTFDNVPYEIVSLAVPQEARGCLPGYENIREYGRLFEPLPTDDYFPFNERMLASIPVLREVGVRVRQVDRSEDHVGGEHTNPLRTEWIIEAPRWDNLDLF